MTEIHHIRRIAMISMHTCPAATPGGFKTGGMNVYIRELSHELARRGIQIDIFTRWQDSCQPHVDQPLDESANVRLIHIAAGPGEVVEPETLMPFVDTFTRGIESFAAANAISYDVIYAHYWLSGLTGLALRDVWHIPLIQMFHTLGVMKDRVAGQIDSVPGVRSLAEAKIMAQVDYLIAATPAEYEHMTRLYNASPSKIHVVPPGVDPERFEPGDPAAAKTRLGLSAFEHVLLFIGRPDPLKAIDTILEALQQVFEADPALRQSLRLLVIGGTIDDTAVQAAINQTYTLDIRDELIFIDAQPQRALPDYFRSADVLLMPSDYESFGLAALEALACGTPVIASQVGGLAYLINDGETGYHIPTRDSAALAAAIQRILTQPEERERLAVNAVHEAQRYTWAHIADQLLTILTADSDR
jgi:D-inositol-3-phosphate glycosyltransferase